MSMIRPESLESDITATSRIRASGSFRLIHIDEYAFTMDFGSPQSPNQRHEGMMGLATVSIGNRE
jgi:hypothetical protein